MKEVTRAFTVMTYDIDFAGVVSNLTFTRWLEDLRNLFAEQTLSVGEAFKRGIAPALTRTEIEFLAPVRFPDTVDGRMWLDELGPARWVLAAGSPARPAGRWPCERDRRASLSRSKRFDPFHCQTSTANRENPSGRRRLIQEEICRHEAALDGIHGKAELFERGETQQDSIPRIPKDDTTGDRFAVYSNGGVADAPLSPASIGEHERYRAELLDAEPFENLSRYHRQRGTGIRKGGDPLRLHPGTEIHHNDLDTNLTHGRTDTTRREQRQ
jgi:hypothetical protein